MQRSPLLNTDIKHSERLANVTEVTNAFYKSAALSSFSVSLATTGLNVLMSPYRCGPKNTPDFLTEVLGEFANGIRFFPGSLITREIDTSFACKPYNFMGVGAITWSIGVNLAISWPILLLGALNAYTCADPSDKAKATAENIWNCAKLFSGAMVGIFALSIVLTNEVVFVFAGIMLLGLFLSIQE